MKQLNIYVKHSIIKVGTCLLLLGTAFSASGQNKESANVSDTIHVSNENMPENWSNVSSINTVQGAAIIKNSAYSLGNALYGLLPGLTVRQGSGEPGQDDPDFRIRGNGTFGNSNYPLVLVDGFEHDLNSLAVEDIESISVLKDASAAILYGGKAANGVIVVTTKRGKQGKSKIAVNILTGLQTPMGLPEFINSADYATLYNQALANDGLPSQYTQAQIDHYRTGDPVYYPNTDWIKELVKSSAPATRANISASGGNKVAQYFASVGYLMNEGIYAHTNHGDYSTNIKLGGINFRSNLDVKLTNDWKLSVDMYGRINNENAPYASTSDIWNSLYKYSSLIPMYVKDNRILGGTATFPLNPMALINEQGYRNISNRYLISNLSTQYDFGKLIKGLVAGVRFGYDNYYTVTDAWNKTNESYSVTGTDSNTGEPVLSSPFGKNTNLTYVSPYRDAQSLRYNLEGYLDYNTSLKNGDKLAAKLLYHQDKLTLGSESPYYSQSIGGLVNYNLKDRYLAELGLSYSGSEAFKKGSRFSLFPAIAVGWILSNEEFLKENSVINFLKLRASAGVNGRSDLGLRFAYRDYYIFSGSYIFGTGTGGTSALIENNLSNPDLTFEKANKYEVGLESVLWHDINFSAAYYYQRRTNILVDQTNLVPSLIGVGLQSSNAGKAESKGIELSLSINKLYKDWGYFAGLNYTLMKSKVLFNGELPVPAGSEYNYRTGQPISQPYGLEFIGFFQSQEDIDSSPVQQFGTVKPGDMKFLDRNHDGYINKYDQGPIGHSVLPKSEFGLSLGAHYKGFDIQGVLQAQLGRDNYMGNNPSIYWPLINDAKISTYVKDHNPWTEQNKATANYPRLTTISNSNNYQSSTFWYKNADFLRLRSLEIGYNLPMTLTSRVKIEKIHFFLRAMNLLTVSNFTYGDPETLGGYPAMKSCNVGINIQF